MLYEELKFQTILNCLVFLVKEAGGSVGKYQLLKALYFAEQRHLVEYGSSITDDSFIKMEFGPVASMSFDIINAAESKFKPQSSLSNRQQAYIMEVLSTSGNTVTVTKNIPEDNLDWLPASAIGILKEEIGKSKNMSFGQLKVLSHDSAWESAESTKPIPRVSIAKALSDDAGLIKHLSYE